MAPYASGPGWELLHGDCIEAMRGMAEASVDAIVCDPPYDLTGVSRNGSPRQNDPATPYGRTRLGGGFMGKTWDATGIAFDAATWAEALRVLKPGGHLLAFGGTRTYHRLACAIEDAGFEVRDQLQWLYGSGFPKSLNVSKAIDKAAGAEREVVGRADTRSTYDGCERGPMHKFTGNVWANGQEGGTSLKPLTAPATPEAAAWNGWGTALKPAHEPICLARKPLAEGTVASNVMAWGTGGINVDACRIGTSDDLNGGAYSPIGERRPSSFCLGGDAGDYRAPAGRWPANVCLSHSPECEQVGTRRVKGSHLDHDCGGGHIFDRGEMHKRGHTAPDGTEEVEAWNCAPGCAVRLLDEQAGVRTSSWRRAQDDRAYPDSIFPQPAKVRGERGHNDTGGPSRFYYVSKASRSERNAGLEGMDARATFQKNTSRKIRRSNPDTGEAVEFEHTPLKHQNHHPTVKPVALMRWLCRLITPPGGLILDPFTGSGSTGLAALAEGFRFIGIEKEAEYCQIIEARLNAASPLKAAA